MGFLAANASALFGILGVVLGGLIAFGASMALKRREFDLAVWQKLLDRRLNAHDALLQVALEMRLVGTLGAFDGEGEVLRLPVALKSREDFDDFFTRTGTVMLAASPWLSPAAIREANYLQDYLTMLHTNLCDAPPEAFTPIGVLIRLDFLDISKRLERVAQEYLRHDVRRLKMRDLDEPHKYSRDETECRLKSSILISRWPEVQAIFEACAASSSASAGAASVKL